MTPRLFYTACFVVATVPIVLCKLVTIDNTVPRLTVTGDILDGHDGRISKFSPDGPYYLHTLSYGLCKGKLRPCPALSAFVVCIVNFGTRIEVLDPMHLYFTRAVTTAEPDGQGCNMTPDRCGFHLDHNVRCEPARLMIERATRVCMYRFLPVQLITVANSDIIVPRHAPLSSALFSVFTSPDLSSGSWKYVANAIDVATRPAGTMFRPDIAFNAATKLYVLWWNWVTPSGEYKGYATSTSVSPEGPFTLVQEVVTLSHSNDTYHAGDWHFFIDDDDTGYVIYCEPPLPPPTHLLAR